MSAASNAVWLLLAALVMSASSAHATLGELVKAFSTQHTGHSAGVVNYTRGDTKGKETKLGGVDAYVATPKKRFSAAVLMVPDIYGWTPQHTRKWADKLADAGFLTVVPDYFNGTARTPADSPASFGAWMGQFTRQASTDLTGKIIAAIKKQYPSVKKLGVQGFCWGGLQAVLLTHPKPAVSASVVYHGSLLTEADIKGIQAPIRFEQSDPELDRQVNTTFYKQIQTTLAVKKAQGVDTGIEYYPGMGHGFALRGGNDTATQEASSKAFNVGLTFLKKYLK